MRTHETLFKLTSCRRDGYTSKLRPESITKNRLITIVNVILYNIVEEDKLDFDYLESVKVDISKTIGIVQEQVNNGSEHLYRYLLDKKETLLLIDQFTRDFDSLNKRQLIRFFRFVKPYISEELSNRLKWYSI